MFSKTDDGIQNISKFIILYKISCFTKQIYDFLQNHAKAQADAEAKAAWTWGEVADASYMKLWRSQI